MIPHAKHQSIQIQQLLGSDHHDPSIRSSVIACLLYLYIFEDENLNFLFDLCDAQLHRVRNLQDSYCKFVQPSPLAQTFINRQNEVYQEEICPPVLQCFLLSCHIDYNWEHLFKQQPYSMYSSLLALLNSKSNFRPIGGEVEQKLSAFTEKLYKNLDFFYHIKKEATPIPNKNHPEPLLPLSKSEENELLSNINSLIDEHVSNLETTNESSPTEPLVIANTIAPIPLTEKDPTNETFDTSLQFLLDEFNGANSSPSPETEETNESTDENFQPSPTMDIEVIEENLGTQETIGEDVSIEELRLKYNPPQEKPSYETENPFVGEFKDEDAAMSIDLESIEDLVSNINNSSNLAPKSHSNEPSEDVNIPNPNVPLEPNLQIPDNFPNTQKAA